MFVEHDSVTSSLSSDGESETQDVETEEEIMMEPLIRLKRDFGAASLDRYPSTDCLLNELLGDIRRSRTTSLASTPTNISSDYETENVFDVKNRSEFELRKMGEWFGDSLGTRPFVRGGGKGLGTILHSSCTQVGMLT